MFLTENYQDKRNRDARYKALRAEGRRPLRYSTGPQLIHPKYVVDYTGLEQFDDGFANMQYKTYFRNIFVVEVV